MTTHVNRIVCSRCGQQVDGYSGQGFTAGYYNVQAGSHWAKYANEGETCVCDACMWADPRYLKDYPRP